MSEVSLLLIDDEESFRKLISKELERSGYRVTQAGTLGEQCARPSQSSCDSNVGTLGRRRATVRSSR